MSDKTTDNRSRGGRALIASILALIMFAPLACYLARGAVSLGDQRQPLLERPDRRYKQCIGEGTRYMRYHHWELLRGVREEVVRYGNRGQIGLHSCRICHTSREQFCDKCHDAVSLKPDCFGCHYYP